MNEVLNNLDKLSKDPAGQKVLLATAGITFLALTIFKIPTTGRRRLIKI